MGSIDQSGSKDVVAFVGRTPCAIGYSGMAYASPKRTRLAVYEDEGEPAVAPTLKPRMNRTYPIARPLYLYTREALHGAPRSFLDWAMGDEGQKVVADVGYVPAARK